MRLARAFLLLLVAQCSLVACTSIAPSIDADPVWAMNGRIAVVAGDRRGAFGFDWAQFERNYTIDLFGPLGLGVARVARSGGRVTLSVPGEPAVSASSADVLLERVTGLAVPVTPLRHWVRGEPAPGRYERTETGFRQSGWTVEYLKFDGDLPVRMRVSRPEARMTLNVRRWEA